MFIEMIASECAPVAQFVLLGSSPKESINHNFWRLKHHLNNNSDCHLEIGYNE